MTRHIADNSHDTGAGRVQHFTRQDREDGIHPAISALHARPQARKDRGSRRLAEFARIEREHNA